MLMARWMVALTLTVVLAGCAAPAESPAPSGSTLSSDPPTTSALSFCDPLSERVLRAPDGSPVEIWGEWTDPDPAYPEDVIRVFLRQTGDCVWIVDIFQVVDPDTGELLPDLFGGEFHGRLGADFLIRGEFADVFPDYDYPGDQWTYGPFTYRIVFNGNEVELVEERTQDPPGCGTGPGSCPTPLHWVRPN
jgi:ABC-type glycerol-3-phosphate transport system substrate-binding protein